MGAPSSSTNEDATGAAMKTQIPLTGLVLTGGGARAADQVGVLKAIAQIRQETVPGRTGNPFPVIAGT